MGLHNKFYTGDRAKREAQWEVEHQAIVRQCKNEEQRKQQAALVARKNALLMRIGQAFELDFLTADETFNADPDAELISGEEYASLKIRFIQDWVAREMSEPLDTEQATAIAATAGNIQVIARAGSGKTKTLVTKAIFLQKHCRVSPHELLLLAFNGTAAEKIKDGLKKALDMHIPHVMTFHALAHALVHPEEELVFDNTDADQLGLSREIQEVIDEHIRTESYRVCIRNLMLAHFRDDWERIVDGRFEFTMDEFLSHRRALPRESLKGDYVKSFGEKLIANSLFEHDVTYHYESNFRWDGFNYRPDFTIPLGQQGGIIIEYFGLRGDTDYDEISDKKRTFWKQRDEWTFIEFAPGDITKHGIKAFVDNLTQQLRKVGVPCQRLSEEEIWELINIRALDGFTKAMTSFIGRCRKRNLLPDVLSTMIAKHKPCSTAEELFINVGASIYQGYLKRLRNKQKEDFDGLMWRSVTLVRNGLTRFVRDKGREHGDISSLRFVMIDEFQDFSQLFFNLVDAIRLKNPSVRFFCVGDDWQAINAFAGSDLGFFKEFSNYFQNTSKHYIRTNYRSPKDVVQIGNALMNDLGVPAEAKRTDNGWVRLCNLDKFIPTIIEQARHGRDEITPALLRLLRSQLDRGYDVVMLSRRNGVPWHVSYGDATRRIPDGLARFLEHIRDYFPEEDRGRITASTAHRYKGLQHGTVVVLDAIYRSFPLIHPNWVFLRIFGDNLENIESEERRLFYVAITRAQNSLALLTETRAQSHYLKDINKRLPLIPIKWDDLPPVSSLDGARMEIRVFNAYKVRNQLIALKYDFNGQGKYWYKAALADGFSIEALLGQTWAGGGVRVEVYSETGKLLYLNGYSETRNGI